MPLNALQIDPRDANLHQYAVNMVQLLNSMKCIEQKEKYFAQILNNW